MLFQISTLELWLIRVPDQFFLCCVGLICDKRLIRFRNHLAANLSRRLGSATVLFRIHRRYLPDIDIA
jgi:hypothetical protein